MSFLHLLPDDYRAMPWKDGGGETTELCIEPPGATVKDGFLWRLSMAKVDHSGPFSRFPGMDRSLLILEGAGLDLKVGKAAKHHLEPGGAPQSFSGDEEVQGELVDGPTLDFNVISNREWVGHTLSRVALGPGELDLPPAPVQILFVVEGEVVVGPWNETLRAHELIRTDDGEALHLRSVRGAKLLRVIVEPA
ncbi:MAG TPA: HutD family protein [Holophagaceae bacterium]|nr:HutD family protein [Holophagaceae bacterium]